VEIQAYFEEWSRLPGDRVRMAVSAMDLAVHARFMRLVSGPGKGELEAGFVVDMPEVLDQSFAVTPKQTVVGSHAQLALPKPVDSKVLTVHCWIFPTAATSTDTQTIWALGELALKIRDGGLQLVSGSQVIATLASVIQPGHWYSVAATLSDGEAVLDLRRLDAKINAHHRNAAPCDVTPPADATLMLAASSTDHSGSPVDGYDGKIDSPTLHLRALNSSEVATLHRGRPVPNAWASWLLGQDFASSSIAPAWAGGKPGKLHNGGERAVTGRNWDGRSDSFGEVPDQYCALQFHRDDMVDSDWAYEIEFQLPTDIASGVYLVRLETSASTNFYPLFVRGAKGSTAPILFLLPTNTYLAYANDHLAAFDLSAIMSHEKVVPEDEKYLFTDAAPGRSCYDTHSDSTPVRYSSRRRPLFNVRPHVRNWLTGSHRHYPVDMYILEWLEHVGLEYHVATDEDLEAEGRSLLDRYNVVITGSHPEYWSRSALDAFDDYLNEGGRAMYLGGNGFYWVTTRFPERPWTIEVRRDNTGTRCWDAPYGERNHVATGEAGGIWRARGRAPNKVVGIGFSSEGFSKACGYRRLEASYNSPAARFFEGVTAEVIGDYGHVLGGAVGDEIDRYDVAIGSPEHAYVLGTSTGLGNEYQVVIEDMTLMLPDLGGEQKPELVRSDMVIFPIDGGGCVFSIGSIAYGGSLAWNNCDNDLSRVTANVLRAMADPAPVF